MPPPARSRPLVALAAAAVALAGCATSGDTEGAQPEAGDVVVELVGLVFQPRSIQVPVGGRVRWQWTDEVVHNVVSKDFTSSGALGGGAYAVTFDRVGTYPYRCTLHTGMDGTVVVKA